MTTQRLNLAPPRLLANMRGMPWSMPVNPQGADGTFATKGDFRNGAMIGRRTNLRIPFDNFEAAIINWPTGAVVQDGDQITINDGQLTVIFEFDSGGGYTPGTVPVVFNAGMTAAQVFAAWWAQLQTLLGLGRLDLQVFANGAVPGATEAYFRSHRSHPGMYGWGAAWESTIGTMLVYGWGRWGTTGGDAYHRRNSGYGRNWFPIRWGLSRGWGAVEEPYQRPWNPGV